MHTIAIEEEDLYLSARCLRLDELVSYIKAVKEFLNAGLIPS